ncbi:MAG: hypothetical protein COT00_03020 [Candidatus Omnitrophica bacterium CG07_land_8_20_14_0_80_50_8]|nr:MAG: hypothetical protein COT00_03020 [Candidatus Omnitrophica bacterium CG07_land_8_20_14_0_80_50_8]
MKYFLKEKTPDILCRKFTLKNLKSSSGYRQFVLEQTQEGPSGLTKAGSAKTRRRATRSIS